MSKLESSAGTSDLLGVARALRQTIEAGAADSEAKAYLADATVAVLAPSPERRRRGRASLRRLPLL